MKMHEMYPANYLKKEDVPTPRTFTIKSIAREEVKGERGMEDRNVAYFVGDVKPMILNKGNATVLCELYGDDSTYWHGKPIEVYNDPSVMFGGKRVGGLRMRTPARFDEFGQSRPPAAAAPTSNGQLWDFSCNGKGYGNKTRAEVQQFITSNKLYASTVRVKPAGSQPGEARTADEHGFADGVEPAAITGSDDVLPF